MKNKIVSIFWGVILIGIGGLWLAGKINLFSIEPFSDRFWMFAAVVGSLAFFLSYFVSGIRSWGWLFPALILAALAGTFQLVISDGPAWLIPLIFLLSIAIPFYVGFVLDRTSWGLLIPAWILTVIAFIPLLSEQVEGGWVAALFLYGAAAPFLIVWLRNRAKRWALIPAYALAVVGTIPLLESVLGGNFAGAFTLYAIALPFLYVYLHNRAQKWALIPAAVLGIIGLFPLLDPYVQGDWMGLIVMALFSLPFFIIYFTSRGSWWALIPAGVFASIGLVVLLTLLLPGLAETLPGIFPGVLFLGLAVTFGVLWLRHRTQQTDWAKYPCLALLGTAVLAVILGDQLQDYLPAAALLIIGIVVVVVTLVRRRQTPED